MADEHMPQDISAWMTERGWGEHHTQWHFERRWDVWHARAARPDASPDLIQFVRDNVAKGYKRAPVQEGQSGNGDDFLFMHRSMIIVLLDEFPQYVHLLRGWHLIPTDPADAEDPVPTAPSPARGPFHPDKAAGLRKLEFQPEAFASDDSWGLFLQTSDLPAPDKPLAQNPDPQTGAHNYMHNRWSDPASPRPLGSPAVNLFNARFWKLHGWIDYQWFRFRRAKGFEDTDVGYQGKLAAYKKMMAAPHHPPHPHHEAAVKKVGAAASTFNAFQFD